MEKTLIIFPMDEDEAGKRAITDEHVFTLCLGGAVKSLAGKKDNTKYDHYSTLRTIEDNWNLG